MKKETKMKKIFYVISMLLVMGEFDLFAQDGTEKPASQVEAKEDKPSPAEGKNHQFGLTVKRMNYTYVPAEYIRTTTDPYPLSSSGHLKKNEQVTLPFALSYYNKNWNLFIEASHYKVNYNDLYYRETEAYIYYARPLGDSIRVYDQKLDPMTRRESKLNFYKQKQLGESNAIFYGLGIRNIFKESYQKYSGVGLNLNEYRDSLNTYGLQLFFKYQYLISSAFRLNLSLEPFLTSGKRNIDVTFYRSYELINRGRGNHYIYGVDADLQLAYSLNENLSLLIGYNYIFTKIQGKTVRAPFIIPSYTTVTEPDHIYGYYIGLNAKF